MKESHAKLSCCVAVFFCHVVKKNRVLICLEIYEKIKVTFFKKVISGRKIPKKKNCVNITIFEFYFLFYLILRILK